MKFYSILPGLISILILGVLTFYFNNEIKKKDLQISVIKNERDSLQNFADSMHFWVFQLDVEMARYERANEQIEEKFPEAAKEWRRFYTQETE